MGKRVFWLLALVIFLGCKGQNEPSRSGQPAAGGNTPAGGHTPGTGQDVKAVSLIDEYKNGDLVLKWLAVEYGPLYKADGDKVAKYKEGVVKIRFEVRNASSSKPASFTSYSDTKCSLTDAASGKEYPQVMPEGGQKLQLRPDDTFGISVSTGKQSIKPGASTETVVLFQVPKPFPEELVLTMPAANLGGEGKLQFRIRGSQI